ncbi:S26 family signal peptidase [Streptomyces avidinii]|nr:S26 family signal peptidase [Streptomyces avidinii]
MPEGRLLLLGDTRGNSADSRYRFEEAEGGTVPLSAVKGALIDEDDPLVVGLRSAVPADGGLLFLGAVSGVVALRLRRRAVMPRHRRRTRCRCRESDNSALPRSTRRHRRRWPGDGLGQRGASLDGRRHRCDGAEAVVEDRPDGPRPRRDR